MSTGDRLFLCVALGILVRNVFLPGSREFLRQYREEWNSDSSVFLSILWWATALMLGITLAMVLTGIALLSTFLW